MANERMYLLHTPSGGYCYMAKRMGYGWYDHQQSSVTSLFSAVASEGRGDHDQDAFEIAFEGDCRLRKQYPEKPKKSERSFDDE